MQSPDQFKNGKPKTTRYEKHKNGFLRFRYDEKGLIENISWASEEDSKPAGLQLYFDWANNMVTFKTANGLSGEEWSGGFTSRGTVYDPGDFSPTPRERKISLEEWIGEKIKEMGS